MLKIICPKCGKKTKTQYINMESMEASIEMYNCYPIAECEHCRTKIEIGENGEKTKQL